MNDILQTPVELPVVEDCWNQIGIKGDRSCDRLAEVVSCHNCPVFADAGSQLFERPPPAEFLRESTEELARISDAPPSKSVTVLIFRVGEEWLAMEIQALIEVGEPRSIHRVPHRSGRLLLGLVNIRGELHLCVSMRHLLGIESKQPCRNWLLVAVDQGRRWVFAVDEVSGVEKVETEQVISAPVTVGNSKIRLSRGTFRLEGKDIGLVLHQRLFQALENLTG